MDNFSLYNDYLDKAEEYNGAKNFGDGLEYAEKAYKLFPNSFPWNYNALMQKKKSLEGLGRAAELEETSGLIKKVVDEDTKMRAEGEARKKHHLTKHKTKKHY